MNIRFVVAVAAGKGGVGKSTVSVFLARFLKDQGYSVGIVDADIYGPSIAKMIPFDLFPQFNEETWIPGLGHGIKIGSFAHFIKEGLFVRAPMANQLILHSISNVDWGELDYLIVDFPPGTGDVQLTLLQNLQFSGALLITTPQIISQIDVEKAGVMFEKNKVPILGVLENLSHYKDFNTDQLHYPFGKGAGEELAKKFSAELFKIPVDPDVSKSGDLGIPLSKEAYSFLFFKQAMTYVQGRLWEIE